MHIGILTGGGDCPGLNAVIRAVTLALMEAGVTRVTGIERGFLGLIEGRARPLDEPLVRDLLAEGGTVLGTHNRADPFHYFGAAGADVSGEALRFAQSLGLDLLVVIGGDGTMTIAERFSRLGLPVIGVPKTIDNDIVGNERSFGFDSAVAVVADALNRLQTTARSHGRVMLLETMGRHAGWIALEGGIAGGADAILIPERRFSLEQLASHCERRIASQGYALVCLAEGVQLPELPRHLQGDAFDGRVTLAGAGLPLQAALESRWGAGVEVRYSLLGHLQRGGAPSTYDRVLSTRFGAAAARAILAGERNRMVALRGDRIVSVPLNEVAGASRPVPDDHELLAVASAVGQLPG
ncbi:MAG: 6-phosphofructokinase [Roseateles depolymerans]|uniref:6-phosphofructokinase n=1 Tax=Roseateles depolymerans TaxID=76731 RepID=A0A2W5DLR5_9BURK|nr:MAG: 6-phosphofructokinase [Roseateles depolymerans]